MWLNLNISEIFPIIIFEATYLQHKFLQFLVKFVNTNVAKIDARKIFRR